MQVDEPAALLMVENMIEADKKSIAEAFIQSLRTENAELLTSISTDDVAWTLPGIMRCVRRSGRRRWHHEARRLNTYISDVPMLNAFFA